MNNNENKTFINEKIHKSLSNWDINKYLDNKCNLILYYKLKKYKTIKEVLGQYNKCVILYQNGRGSGHWTCLYKIDNKKDTIYFFDSYGLMIDKEFIFITKNIKRELGIDYNYLSKLLYDSKLKVEFNEYQLQTYKSGYNTCGRWVMFRLKNNNLSVKEFYKLFRGFKNKDLIITLLTIKI